MTRELELIPVGLLLPCCDFLLYQSFLVNRHNAAHKLGLEDDEIAEYRQSYLEAAKQKDAEVTRYMVISSEDMIDQIKAAQGIYYHEQKDNDKAWETIKDADMAAVPTLASLLHFLHIVPIMTILLCPLGFVKDLAV